MAVEGRPVRARSRRRRRSDQPQPDNRLALLDHAFFTGQRATNQDQVLQVVWVYEHALNFDGLQRFHHYLGRGLLARRIERSPLPFARHRWVSNAEQPGIEVAEHARPRAEVSDWADERSQLPIDPEAGPGWHLGVLPLEDGATAVTLVVSHYLIDGLGLIVALIDALMGETRDLGLPPPRSRTPLRAAAHDARKVAQDIPEATRALRTVTRLARQHRRELAAAARLARRHREEIVRSPASPPAASPDAGASGDLVIVPAVTIHVGLEHWDARAAALNGTSKALFAGFTAKLGERIGRRGDDGAITLQLPVSTRTEGDTRGNAMTVARVTVDPTQVTTDLSSVRATIKQELSNLTETSDAPPHLWLTQFAPKRALRRLSSVMVVGDTGSPIFCSNLGDVGTIIRRLDGTDAEYATARAVGQHLTRQWLEETGGLMRLQGWRIGGKFGISVIAYQPGAANTRDALREMVALTLADFGLTGQID
ncbi:hypothetical protein [Mycobacterium sp. 852014-52144_SCH5372336]|uniref:hypothetical protein n=1 Tax=Mycobacterium sp. 852014-52144_SCH5372336 TaxID=1834115 RepID=UPI0007FBA160|nr:hypothetical protein A5759_08085 [Mycobacterium sp. 852014-52144_SCH5372336]